MQLAASRVTLDQGGGGVEEGGAAISGDDGQDGVAARSAKVDYRRDGNEISAYERKALVPCPRKTLQ